MSARAIEKRMSDHHVVMVEVEGKNGTLNPRRAANKEMFFSNILNDIKEKHLKHYLRYILQMISSIMN